MDDYRVGDLSIDSSTPDDSDVLKLVWHGKSTDRQPSKTVLPYLCAALDRAAELGRKLELRFEELEHFNSSTISALVQLIHEARRRNSPMALVYDRNIKWQRLSFEALAVLARDGVVELRTT